MQVMRIAWPARRRLDHGTLHFGPHGGGQHHGDEAQGVGYSGHRYGPPADQAGLLAGAAWQLPSRSGAGRHYSSAAGRFVVVRSTPRSCPCYYFPSGFGGFCPYFASYSAATLAASFGLQRKHCDSGRLCAWHQSPFRWYSAATLELH